MGPESLVDDATTRKPGAPGEAPLAHAEVGVWERWSGRGGGRERASSLVFKFYFVFSNVFSFDCCKCFFFWGVLGGWKMNAT